MNLGSQKFGLILITLAIVTALVASSCAPVKVSGERVVKMGQQACFTGPGATLGVPFSSGHIDCLKPINQRGGIDGIKLEMLWEETGALVPRYVTAYRRMARKGIVISTNYLSSGTEVIVPMLIKDEIPHLYGSTGLTSPMVTEPTQWVLAAHAGFASEFVAFTKWVKQNWTESRPPRIGAFICDTGAGWELLEGVDYFPEGVEYIGHEVLPLLGVIDSTVELLRLASKKPDYIFVTHYAGSLAVIIKDFA